MSYFILDNMEEGRCPPRGKWRAEHLRNYYNDLNRDHIVELQLIACAINYAERKHNHLYQWSSISKYMKIFNSHWNIRAVSTQYNVEKKEVVKEVIEVFEKDKHKGQLDISDNEWINSIDDATHCIEDICGTFQCIKEDVLSNNECFTGHRMWRVENKLQQILEEALAKEWETR